MVRPDKTCRYCGADIEGSHGDVCHRQRCRRLLRSENRDKANEKRRRLSEEEQYRRDREAEAEASKLAEWIYAHMGDQIRDMQGLPLHTECVICGNPLPPGRQTYCSDSCALLGSMARGRWMRARRKRGRNGSSQ